MKSFRSRLSVLIKEFRKNPRYSNRYMKIWQKSIEVCFVYLLLI